MNRGTLESSILFIRALSVGFVGCSRLHSPDFSLLHTPRITLKLRRVRAMTGRF